jgi:hypothetical protein
MCSSFLNIEITFLENYDYIVHGRITIRVELYKIHPTRLTA